MSLSLPREPALRPSPVVLRHKAFRAAFLALAYPGRLFLLPGPEASHAAARNGRLSPAEEAAALLFGAVWEADTPVCSVGSVRFLPPTLQPADAGGAEVLVVAESRSHGAILAASRGTEEAPERGAAVLYVLPEPRIRTDVRLSGPGIHGSLETGLPLPPIELRDRNTACADWPLGVDVLIVDDTAQVVALPRTTRVEVLN